MSCKGMKQADQVSLPLRWANKAPSLRYVHQE